MMLKKIGLVAAVAAAGMVLFGGMASAAESHPGHEPGGNHSHRSADDNVLAGQAGLVNLNNLDILHNVNLVLGLCDNNINALGVQVPVQHVADGLNIPILSPGENTADGSSSCAAGAINDGGTNQAN